MTQDEIKNEIQIILEQLPDKALIVALEDLKKIQKYSNDIEIFNDIVTEDAELLRRLAD